MRWGPAVALAAALAAGCTKAPRKDGPVMVDDGSATPVATARVVRTFAELKAAEGQLVHVSGPVFHEKLGDGVEVDGLSILCPDLRLPDGVTEAALEGRLEMWEPPAATTNDRGEISQGTEGESSRWVLRDCMQV